MADLFVNNLLKQIVFDLRKPAPDIGLNIPIQPEVNLLKVYYPISRSGEFDQVAQTYRTAKPVTVRQLLDSIYLFYNQPLTKQNIQAYLQYPGYSPSIQTLRDVLGNKLIVTNLVPYKDGFLVNLSPVE